jgi:diguanylate cyclase (GGDEF)-like protein
MKILIVDDMLDHLRMLAAMLRRAGHSNLVEARSAREALSFLHLDDEGSEAHEVVPVDLIMMDIRMPEIDGIEACRRIKASEAYRDVPIIMVSAQAEACFLQEAFVAGAMDFISKPIDRIELISRVRSALALKQERDLRKSRERELLKLARQLEEANRRLERLSSLDPLTGLANRRGLDGFLEMEWRRARRDREPLSVILIDVDHFKPFNDTYGHPAGDTCLRRVAEVLSDASHRPGDMAARYGGDEFAVVLSQTGASGARVVADLLRTRVEALRIPHRDSPASSVVTISIGVATIVPTAEGSADQLLGAADGALYTAKREGRNRVCHASGEGGKRSPAA